MGYCVGVFGCLFLFTKSLCWNVCWLAGFWVSVLKAILCPKNKMVIIFGAPNCDLGGLVPPFWYLWGLFWHLGGTLGDLGSSRKDTWGSRVTFLVIFVWFWDPILKAFRAPRARNLVLFSSSFPCPFWHRRLLKRGFVWKVLQKTTFRRSRCFYDFGVEF